jgi:hypothetical protein
LQLDRNRQAFDQRLFVEWLAQVADRSAFESVQNMEALLALAAADDLTNAGCKHIHSSDYPAVVIHADRG